MRYQAWDHRFAHRFCHVVVSSLIMIRREFTCTSIIPQFAHADDDKQHSRGTDIAHDDDDGQEHQRRHDGHVPGAEVLIVCVAMLNDSSADTRLVYLGVHGTWFKFVCSCGIMRSRSLIFSPVGTSSTPSVRADSASKREALWSQTTRQIIYLVLVVRSHQLAALQVVHKCTQRPPGPLKPLRIDS